MAYMEKGTMTGQALRYMTDNSFSHGHGARPGVTKVGIVFTDGRSQDYIGDAAKKAKDMGTALTSPSLTCYYSLQMKIRTFFTRFLSLTHFFCKTEQSTKKQDTKQLERD